MTQLERRLAAVASALVAVHLLDVLAWRPAVAFALVLALIPRLPATARAAVEVALAAVAAAVAWLHVLHVRWDGFARSDATGIAVGVAALLFVAAAAAALRSRRRLGGWRRTGRNAATVAGAVALLLFAVVPLAVATWLGGKPRRPLSPATFPIAHIDVSLRARDGVHLSGWYVPPRNGATIVLVHGGGGDRNGVRRQALLLARHGYGVLLYDERGRGRSGGSTQSMGWNWVQDVEAAVDYAAARGARVGALGLSTGAEVVVTAAAHDPRIRAVVAEGLIGRDLADAVRQQPADDVTGLPYWGVAYAALAVESGTRPPEPLADDLRGVAPRPLLVVSSEQNAPERAVASGWERAAGPTAQLWLVRAGHTQALETHPREYARRVLGLFGRALLQRP